MATATAGSRQSQQREEENELSLPLLGGASDPITHSQEISDLDNFDEAKTKLLESSTSASAQVHKHVQEHCDGDESLTKKQLNEGNSTPIERQSQQIPTEDESAAVARTGAGSTTVINIDAELKGEEDDGLVNNRNSSASAEVNNEAGGGSNAKDDSPSGSRSGCCVVKCISTEWMERHKDGIKLIQLWLSFLLRIGAFLFDLGLDIALLCDYGANGDWWYFSLTLFFVLFPSFIISVVNSNYYDEKWDVKRQIKETDDKFNLKDKLIIDPEWKFHLRRIFCLFLVSPLARYNFI